MTAAVSQCADAQPVSFVGYFPTPYHVMRDADACPNESNSSNLAWSSTFYSTVSSPDSTYSPSPPYSSNSPSSSYTSASQYSPSGTSSTSTPPVYSGSDSGGADAVANDTPVMDANGDTVPLGAASVADSTPDYNNPATYDTGGNGY